VPASRISENPPLGTSAVYDLDVDLLALTSLSCSSIPLRRYDRHPTAHEGFISAFAVPTTRGTGDLLHKTPPTRQLQAQCRVVQLRSNLRPFPELVFICRTPIIRDYHSCKAARQTKRTYWKNICNEKDNDWQESCEEGNTKKEGKG